jgi:deoxyribodipyrimidine photo-lyase
LYINNEYEVNEAKRDLAIEQLLAKDSVLTFRSDDQVVMPPGSLRSQAGNVYTVYSPFKKAWFEMVRNLKEKYLTLMDASYQNPVQLLTPPVEKPDDVPASVDGFDLDAETRKKMIELYPAGEEYAHKKLHEFGEKKALTRYKTDRDFPNKTGTSGLSPYLASGVISAKQCVVKAMEFNGGKLDTGSEGAVVWIQEIIWRDFYKHILHAYPRVCKDMPFKLDTLKVGWRFDEKEFEAWCEGRTGYPIVDAGMRQLNATGWMHNRVRMIVASFLTKHLLHNWQLGEKYFMEHLIDGDFASNNGGWQWSASTGTDAQPYFRVFNPLLQSKKFDPNGEYIKRWVPELKTLAGDTLHDPSNLPQKVLEKLGYPGRIVEHESSRKRAIEAFQKIKGEADISEKYKKQSNGEASGKVTKKLKTK